MPLRLKQGVLVAIEGIDGSGKTTQVAALEEALRRAGLEATRSKEPTDGQWGRQLRESAATGRMSAAAELDLFIADRREHVTSVIRPALDSGRIHLLDRYYFSTAAYQGARGMDPEQILCQNEEFAPQPDVVVILEVPPSEGLRRIRLRGDIANEFEREDNLERCAAIFAKLSRAFIRRIDGTLSPGTIRDAILSELYQGPLFARLCYKSNYKAECEPAFCTERISGVCKYNQVSIGSSIQPQTLIRR